MTTYPRHREADVVLRDGSTVHVRPARPADAAAVKQLLTGLSLRSRRLRFFSGHPNLEKAVQWATDVDYDRRYGLVASSGAGGRVVAAAGWERQPDRPERAEVALEIADAMQGKGLGTILLGQLADAADELGVRVLEAEVLSDNYRMIRVFRDCGLPVRTHTLPGVLLVEFPTSVRKLPRPRASALPVSRHDQSSHPPSDDRAVRRPGVAGRGGGPAAPEPRTQGAGAAAGGAWLAGTGRWPAGSGGRLPGRHPRRRPGAPLRLPGAGRGPGGGVASERPGRCGRGRSGRQGGPGPG
jgi:RimJ/RimL family protein N-acetyltransferase